MPGKEAKHMKCPHCETENMHGELFCTECGAQLANADSTIVSSGSAITEPTKGLVPGTSLQNGRYVITKMLGEGGMGSVMLAKDTRLADKLTVIKALNADSADTGKLHEDVRNFKREAETLAHLDHPLIPDVTDHFEEDTHYYMVMDYVEGENLEDWLERTNQPMKEQDALKYALEVLDILEYLSKQQPAIIHRDIKPANIIIGTKDKHAHLVDFGIARTHVSVNEQRRKTTALGTPGYAPPEQYQGYTDPRSDLYALAATLHHLVTNRDPSDYPSFQYPLVRTLNSRISEQLEQILSKALKINPDERYQTALDMRQDVESLLAGTLTIGLTDGYRLNDSTTLRALPPQPSRRRTTNPFDRYASPADSFSATGTRRSQRQQQQQQQPMQRPGYLDADYDSDGQPRSPHQTYQRPRPVPRPPRPIRQSPPQSQHYYNYRNNSPQINENQLLWRFIFFVVAICIIGLIAYSLFSSLPLR
jgi:eukaryotic-like serine/threonine-protein kinase